MSYGDGVYKSTDGGKSWKNVGLSFWIGRLIVHPKDPNVVDARCSRSALWGGARSGFCTNSRTGQNWSKVL